METLVTDLAPASRIADTSWIKPGRASWAWWSYPDGPETTNLFNKFTDFAAKMGWEYTLFDAGWWKPGLKPIADHAHDQGVMPLAWNYAGDFYDAKQSAAKKLDEMAAAGIRGHKGGFLVFRPAGSHRRATGADARRRCAASMMVNLHGCTIPRGWQRTWPNFLSAEAVLGNESPIFTSRVTLKRRRNWTPSCRSRATRSGRWI